MTREELEMIEVGFWVLCSISFVSGAMCGFMIGHFIGTQRK